MEYRLEELCNISSSKRIYRKEYQQKGIPFYRGKEIIQKANNISISDKLYISTEKYNEIEQKYGVPHKGDILITAVGTIGVSYLVKDERFYFKDGNLIWIKDFDKKIDNEYLFIYLNSLKFKNELEKISIGSTQRAITILELKKIKINIPSIEIQKKIVKIYKGLDEKIELNNHINNNLYEVGMELLKNDFILENERKPLSQVIKFVKGKKPSDISANKQVGYEKYLTIACLNGQELNYADTNKMIISDNDLLMVMDGASSGEVYYGGQGIVGSTLSRIDCINNNYISEFIFFSLKYYKDLIQSKNTGSAIPHTDKVFVGSLEIPKLDIGKQEKYKVLLSKIQHNQNENKTLENLRDTLLPKLINGKIDLDKIKI